MEAFLTQDVSNAGRRGRPPLAREVYYRHEVVLDESGEVELGELTMEPQKNGTVILTAVVNGTEQSIVFGKPKGRPRKTTKKNRKAE